LIVAGKNEIQTRNSIAMIKFHHDSSLLGNGGKIKKKLEKRGRIVHSRQFLEYDDDQAESY